MHLPLYTYGKDSRPVTYKTNDSLISFVSMTGTTTHPWLLPSIPPNPSLSSVDFPPYSAWILLCCSTFITTQWIPINDFLSGLLHPLLSFLQPQYTHHLLHPEQTVTHQLKTLWLITGPSRWKNKISSTAYEGLLICTLSTYPSSTLTTLPITLCSALTLTFLFVLCSFLSWGVCTHSSSCLFFQLLILGDVSLFSDLILRDISGKLSQTP